MDFTEYQIKARHTAIYPDIDANIYYPALGLASEAGEVCGKIKKIMRDNGGVVSVETRLKLTDELGDVLWYVSNLASELDIDLERMAVRNIDKLALRKERNTLKGDGDNR